jgi:sugar-specific transcriptional regulator TrmB
MAKDLIHILQAAGLSSEEAELYIKGLELGSVPASTYAKVTGFNRITTYNMLESMVERGLATSVKRERSKFYEPVSPESLAVEVRKNADALERSLPELRSLRGAEYRKPHVKFFEGWDGVRRVYEDTLTAKSEILNFANSLAVRQFWPSYDDEYVAERVRRKIRLRGIAPDDETGRRVHGEDKKKYREIRLVPAKQFDFQNEINIYDHKMAICSFPTKSEQDIFGVIIESQEVAKAQRQIFELAWNSAGERRRGLFG